MMSSGGIFALLGLFCLQSTLAFTANPSFGRFQRSRSVAFSTSMSNDEGQDTVTEMNDHSDVIDFLKSAEIQEVREELVLKYVQLGKSPEDAERDVNDFLSDPEQSAQYLEMRRYAKAQADELGFELYLQLGGAFVVGLAATALPKYYSAYKTIYPDGGGPIPFL